MRMLCGEQRVSHPTLLLIFDHHQPQFFDITHLGRQCDTGDHECTTVSAMRVPSETLKHVKVTPPTGPH